MKGYSKEEMKKVVLKHTSGKYSNAVIDEAFEKAFEYARCDGVENVVKAFCFLLEQKEKGSRNG